MNRNCVSVVWCIVNTVVTPLCATACGGVSNNGQGTATGGSSPNTPSGGMGNTGGAPLPQTSTFATGGGSVSTSGGSGTYQGTGGSSVAGGAHNTGGTFSTPPTTVVGPPAVDVLFMVDNSSSMADKQQILAASVPRLIDRLVQPNCVDNSGTVVGKSQLGTCAQGTPEFSSVNNLHIGVITSSLGDHGTGKVCTSGLATGFTDASGQPITVPSDVNDMGRLMGTLTRGTSALSGDSTFVQSTDVKLDSQGFLAWNSTTKAATAADLTSAQHAFADMVAAAGEKGCGYEAQLESWFRFLVDPVPPVMPITKDSSNQTHRTGSDDVLLAQRAAFLRPNSTLAIVMLTDENDCSLRDTDVGWVAADASISIPTGSSQCQTNPNDKCCYSCSVSSPPSGCTSGCASPAGAAKDDSASQANLRCWHQKLRFGYEFMYPLSRYVVGLTRPQLCPDQTFGDMDCDCTYAKSIGASCSPGTRTMPNPLFSTVVGRDNSGNDVLAATQVAPRSDNSRIYLAGILGVPWQDVGYVNSNGSLVYIPVTDPAWRGSGSTVAPATAAPNGIWSNIYDDDNANVVPGDVHMVESLVPRQGLPAPTAAANADPIVGHEWNTAHGDLEYACIFPLPTSKPCACIAGSANYSSCKYQNPNDCCDLSYTSDAEGGPGDNFDKPVCNGTTQVAAKAYPGLREIAILHDYALNSTAVQGNSIVASICAKDLTGDPSSAGYGYNPAIDALVARMKERGFR